MKLLILGSAILAAGDLTETATSINAPDAIYPKHVITGWALVDIAVPQGFTPGGYEWVNGAVQAKPADLSILIAVKKELSAQIDAAVIAIYDRPMQLSKEYEAREKAAADYKAAGYIGAVPAWLAGFATPAGMEPQAAADLVLSQAAQMRGALDSLGALRMRKYEVQLASTEADARTAHTDIMAQIAAVAAGLD